ncbi:MAG: condensation domain-containing protein [Byssovorax sp.]
MDPARPRLAASPGPSLRPFDPASGAMLRAHLYELRDDDHALLVAMHHIIGDAWTLAVLNRELGALYDAFRENKPSPLPPLPIQYADYAAWQRSWLHGEALERHLAYWKTQLDGAPHALGISRPIARARPCKPTMARAPSLLLGKELTAAVHDLPGEKG